MNSRILMFSHSYSIKDKGKMTGFVSGYSPALSGLSPVSTFSKVRTGLGGSVPLTTSLVDLRDTLKRVSPLWARQA